MLPWVGQGKRENGRDRQGDVLEARDGERRDILGLPTDAATPALTLHPPNTPAAVPSWHHCGAREATFRPRAQTPAPSD